MIGHRWDSVPKEKFARLSPIGTSQRCFFLHQLSRLIFRASIAFEIWDRHHEAKRGFVLLPRRWVVERTFGWLGRFRRLARDYERLVETLVGYHWIAFIALMLARLNFQSA
jgi:transposase